MNSDEALEFQDYVKNLKFYSIEDLEVFCSSYREQALKTKDPSDVLRYSIIMTVHGGVFLNFTKFVIDVMALSKKGDVEALEKIIGEMNEQLH